MLLQTCAPFREGTGYFSRKEGNQEGFLQMGMFDGQEMFARSLSGGELRQQRHRDLKRHGAFWKLSSLGVT